MEESFSWFLDSERSQIPSQNFNVHEFIVEEPLEDGQNSILDPASADDDDPIPDFEGQVLQSWPIEINDPVESANIEHPMQLLNINNISSSSSPATDQQPLPPPPPPPPNNSIHNNSPSLTGQNPAADVTTNYQFTIGSTHERILPARCEICKDRASGKHYGAISCDGCKGFFRRSIRRKNTSAYICSQSRNCAIDRQKRNKCRYCRLQKCFKAGMNAETVQDTRDRIVMRRRKHHQPDTTVQELTIESLIQASRLVKLIDTPLQLPDASPNATNKHIYTATATQLAKLVQWSQNIAAFQNLEPQDRELLLKSHASEHLVLGVTYRSACLNDDVLLLSNNMVLNKNHSVEIEFYDGKKQVSTSFLQKFLNQLRALNLSEEEYVLLDAIKLFNPDIDNLRNATAVRELRKKLLIGLEDVMSERAGDNRGRLGEILLIVPTIETVSRTLQNQICHYDVMFNCNEDVYGILSKYLID